MVRNHNRLFDIPEGVHKAKMIPFTPAKFFDLGFMDFYIHGFMAFVGGLIGFIIYMSMARKQKVGYFIATEEFIWTMFGAWLGSKLIFFLGPYSTCGEIGLAKLLTSGFVFYGGLLGGTLACYIYTKIKHFNFWKHSDYYGIALPIALFLCRIGCTFVNDAPGTITTLPWALALPDGTTRHPAAIYLSLLNLFLFVYLYSTKSDKKFDGQIFLKYLMLYSAGRFLIEFFRVYEFYFYGLTFSQLVSIAIFIPAAIIYLRKSGRF